MPARSKAQFRFMEAVKHGMKPRQGSGLTPEKAAEFVDATRSYKALPAKVTKRKKGLLG